MLHCTGCLSRDVLTVEYATRHPGRNLFSTIVADKHNGQLSGDRHTFLENLVHNVEFS